VTALAVTVALVFDHAALSNSSEFRIVLADTGAVHSAVSAPVPVDPEMPPGLTSETLCAVSVPVP
jgi:hypothetical protein